MKKAVLFDFWGTVVQQGAYSPLKQTYQLMRPRMHFGVFVEKFERIAMTKPYDDQNLMYKDAFEAFGMEPKDWIIERLVGVWNKSKLLATPYPETIKVLEELKKKGIKLGLISNTFKSSVDGLLEKFGMDKLFDVVCFSCDTGYLKTDVEMINHALKQLGVTKEETIMVGDSMQTDIVGAEKAGVFPVLIDRKGTREYTNKIASLTELEKFLG